MLYNLISDIIGGVEVTLAEKPQRLTFTAAFV